MDHLQVSHRNNVCIYVYMYIYICHDSLFEVPHLDPRNVPIFKCLNRFMWLLKLIKFLNIQKFAYRYLTHQNDVHLSSKFLFFVRLKNCIMRSCMTCAVHHIFFGWTIQDERGGWCVYHVWDTKELHTKFWWGELTEIDH